MVCLHGLTRNGGDFDPLAQHLATRGMRVIAPDLPGRGRSERLPGMHHYVTATYLSAMTALLCRLDVQEVDWVGTSLGGHVGMELAARHGAPLRRLVLERLRRASARCRAQSPRPQRPHGKQFNSMDDLERHLRTVYEPFGTLPMSSGGT